VGDPWRGLPSCPESAPRARGSPRAAARRGRSGASWRCSLQCGLMVMTRRAWRMILLASLGGTLEYYDFVIFGIFAAQIGRAFFPSQDPLVSLMVTFTTFAIGYLARPIGGLVLGRLGDKFGRRGVFLASIFVPSAATLGIGIVPTYAAWGIAASIIVVLLRLTQGFVSAASFRVPSPTSSNPLRRWRRLSAAWYS